MVHVRKGKQCVKRRINRGGNAIFAERRKRIVTDHFVFVRLVLVEGFQLFQSILIKQCKSSFRDGSQVATAALHSKHARWFSCKRIRKFYLRTRVTATKVGDSQVSSEEIRAIAQQAQGIVGKFFGDVRIPQVGQIRRLFDFRHTRPHNSARNVRLADPIFLDQAVRKSPPEKSAR